MKQVLRFLALAALICVPWVTQAQQSLPYSYGFEDNDLSTDGWTTVNESTNNAGEFGINTAAKTGTYGFRFSSYTRDYTSYNQYLISPELAGTNGVVVTFCYAASSSDGTETFKVGYSTTDDDISSFTFGDEISTSSTSWTLSGEFAFPAGTKYVAIYYYSDYQYRLYVDDISFTAPASCAKPTALAAGSVTATGATLTWTAGGSETDWTVEYGTAADFTGAVSQNVATNPFSLIGLIPATTYYVRVKAVCGVGDESNWSTAASFTTSCVAVASFPWNEDFESATADAVPNCWDNSASTSSTLSSYPERIWGVYSYSGNKMLRMYNYYVSNGTALINTPPITLPSTGDYQFTFDYSHRANCGAFTVKISTDGGTSFTDLQTYASTGSNDYTNPGDFTEATLSLASYMGQTVILQFFSTANYDNGAIFLDNIRVDEAPSCLKPTDVTCSATTTTTATLGWTETGAATAWQICLDSDEANPIDAATNPFTLTGLTSATTYTVKVRANCGANGYSDWSNAASFTTECAAIAAVGYTQNFDDLTAGNNVLPLCWSYINTTTYSSYQGYPKAYPNGYYTTYSHSAPNCLYFYSYYSSYSDYDPQPQYAILPEMTGPAGKQVTLWAKGYNATSTFKIGTMSDPTDASTFAPITEQALTTSYQEFEYLVPTTTDAYLAIMIDAANSSRTTNGVYIDDISIAEPPTCPKPSGLTSTRTAHTATLSWTNGANDQTAWQVAYSTSSTFAPAADFTPNGTTEWLVDAGTNPYTLTGLTPSTTYYAYVRANCGGGDESAWCTTKATFTTTNGIGIPTGLAVDNATLAHNTATVTWSRVATNNLHESFDIYLSTESTNPTAETVPTYTGITAMTYTFTGLTEATTYYVWVRDVCGTDGNSAWSSRVTINTTVFCPAPTGVAVSSATAHGATISWTGTSDSYNVYVGKATVNNTTYDFEGNAISADFTNDATYAWTVTDAAANGSTYSIKSGNTDVNSSTSTITLTVTLVSEGNLSFAARCSSEQTSQSSDWDYGTFLIDDVQQGDKFINSTTFSTRNYTLAAGTHTLKWRYKKDGFTSSNDDCFYVDDISITSVEVASWESYEAPASPYVLNDDGNIDPETDYAVKVVGVCESVESTRKSATVLFTTSADCGASNAVVSNIDYHSADVAWDGSSDAGYMVMLGYEDGIANDFVDENFAGGVPTSAEWTNDATYPWTAFDGYIKSSNAGESNSTSQLTLTVDMDAAGYVEFDAECRGEGTGSNYYDKCIFSIDGSDKFTYGAQRTSDGFVHYSFPVAAGTHTFVWKYTKDGSVNSDGDYMAIDNLHIYTTNITWDEVEVVDVNNYTFDGLEDNTHYYVKVSPECNRTIESNAAEFTTLALPTFNVKANNWYALSSPMHDAGQTYESVANVENLTTGTYDFLRYDEPTSTWKSQKSGGFSTLEPGRGYIYRRANDAVLKVDGEPNTGNVNVAITKDVDGWNLIGNPFMVPIRLNSTYMAPSSDAVLTSGGYKLSTNGMWTVITSSTDIAVGQAVLVKATNAGTLTLRPSASKSAAGEEENGQGFAFTVSNDVYSDVAYAMFADGEGLPKISHLNPEAPMLSIDGYAIANLNEGIESFPMSFSGQGSYTLTVSGNTDVTGYLHLVDRLTGRDIDLLSTPSYSFTGSPVSDRFTVKLTPDANEGSSTSRFAIFDGNSLIVNGEGTLEVYDVMGRRLMSAEVTGSEYRIPGSDLHTGVYVLRMNGNSQKIVIK